MARCPKCDYDLTGLPEEHNCPECGFEYDRHACTVKLAPCREHYRMIVAGVFRDRTDVEEFVKRAKRRISAARGTSEATPDPQEAGDT